MKNVYLLLMLLLALPLLAAPPKPKAPKALAWKPYTNPAFNAQFPGVPTASTQSNNSPLGQVVTNLFTCPVSLGSFTITYTDLPAIAASFAEGKAFDGARDGLLQDAQAQLVSYTDWQHGSDDAKDVVYKNARIQGHAWLIMVSSRLYVVDARVKAGTPPAQVQPFFNSFSYPSH